MNIFLRHKVGVHTNLMSFQKGSFLFGEVLAMGPAMLKLIWEMFVQLGCLLQGVLGIDKGSEVQQAAWRLHI